MEEKEKTQLVNLASFIEMFFVPSLGALRISQNRLEEQRRLSPMDFAPEEQKFRDRVLQQAYGVPVAHAGASLWEAYLWLHLGVEIGFFPRELA